MFINQLLSRIIDYDTSTEHLATFRFAMINTIRRLLGTVKQSPEKVFENRDIIKEFEVCEDSEEFKTAIVYEGISPSQHIENLKNNG